MHPVSKDCAHAEIQAWFAEMTSGLPGPPYWLELHDAPRLGANAMALPARIVFVTDQLVDLAENDDELARAAGREALARDTSRHGGARRLLEDYFGRRHEQ